MDWNSLPELSTARAKTLRKLQARKQRRAERVFVAEGVRLVEEALRCDTDIEWAVAARTDDLRTAELIHKLAAKHELYRAEGKKLSGLLDAVNPQNIAVVCRMPGLALSRLNIQKKSLVIICDTLRDPGNFGAIVRTAAASGCDAVITVGESVDPWNPKAVRGSMGAIFRVPIIEVGGTTELEKFIDEHGFSVYLADMSGRDIFTIESYPSRSALILGGEADGAVRLISGLSCTPISVPMVEGSESLNVAVAAGIIAYHINRNQPESA